MGSSILRRRITAPGRAVRLLAALSAAILGTALPAAAGAGTSRTYLPDVEITDSLLLFDMPQEPGNFTIEVRGALPDDRDSFRPGRHSWGLVWDADSALTHGSFVSLASFRTSLGDPTDRQGLRVTCGGLPPMPGHAAEEVRELTQGINDTGRPHSIIVELRDSTARIFAGNTSMTLIATLPRPDSKGGRWGIRANGRWQSSLIVTEEETAPQAALVTDWTREALDSHLAASVDPAEGIWRYLDRTNDPALGRPGGTYLLATVSNDHGGYDILYLGGAKVWASRWKPLMLKGRLTPAGFPGEYDLTWFDATMQPLSTPTDECSATLTPRSLLVVRFPLQDTTLRFAPPAR